jgi:hypothetical protein
MMSHLEFVKGPELRRVILFVWSILLEGCIINNTTYFPALFSRSNKEIMKTASPDWRAPELFLILLIELGLNCLTLGVHMDESNWFKIV